MAVCTIHGTVITRALMHSMEELDAILRTYYEYYFKRKFIAEDFETWKQHIVSTKESE
jgi:hypothetical protein